MIDEYAYAKYSTNERIDTIIKLLFGDDGNEVFYMGAEELSSLDEMLRHHKANMVFNDTYVLLDLRKEVEESIDYIQEKYTFIGLNEDEYDILIERVAQEIVKRLQMKYKQKVSLININNNDQYGLRYYLSK